MWKESFSLKKKKRKTWSFIFWKALVGHCLSKLRKKLAVCLKCLFKELLSPDVWIFEYLANFTELFLVCLQLKLLPYFSALYGNKMLWSVQDMQSPSRVFFDHIDNNTNIWSRCNIWFRSSLKLHDWLQFPITLLDRNISTKNHVVSITLLLPPHDMSRKHKDTQPKGLSLFGWCNKNIEARLAPPPSWSGVTCGNGLTLGNPGVVVLASRTLAEERTVRVDALGLPTNTAQQLALIQICEETREYHTGDPLCSCILITDLPLYGSQSWPPPPFF